MAGPIVALYAVALARMAAGAGCLVRTESGAQNLCAAIVQTPFRIRREKDGLGRVDRVPRGQRGEGIHAVTRTGAGRQAPLRTVKTVVQRGAIVKLRRAVLVQRIHHTIGGRLADVAWTHGTLTVGATPPEPAGLDDGSAAAVLDAAEDIVNAIGSDVMAEVEAERNAKKPGIFKRIFKRGG